MRLQMPKRLPPAGRVTQASPECGCGDAVVTDGQRPDPLRGRELREKLRAGIEPDSRIMRPETAKVLIEKMKG